MVAQYLYSMVCFALSQDMLHIYTPKLSPQKCQFIALQNQLPISIKANMPPCVSKVVALFSYTSSQVILLQWLHLCHFVLSPLLV